MRKEVARDRTRAKRKRDKELMQSQTMTSDSDDDYVVDKTPCKPNRQNSSSTPKTKPNHTDFITTPKRKPNRTTSATTPTRNPPVANSTATTPKSKRKGAPRGTRTPTNSTKKRNTTPNRRNSTYIEDRGGTLVSIPVQYFNDSGGWKKQFPFPKVTFVVAMVQYTNRVTQKHDMIFIGTPADDKIELFQITDQAYIAFKELWWIHGSREIPTYQFRRPGTGVLVDDDDDTKTIQKPVNPSTSRQQNLSEIWPQYHVDWATILQRKWKHKLGQRIGSGGAFLTPPTDICEQAMRDTVNKVVSTRRTWEWCDSSCHLDSWLMVELSFFGYLANTDSPCLTDDVVLNTPALARLFKVLFDVGTKTQDVSKMAYWIMEIEQYQGGGKKVRKEFKTSLDYHRHEEFVNRELHKDNNLNLSYINLAMTAICDNPSHGDSHVFKHIPHVPVDDFWYTYPDEWTRTKDAHGKWQTNQCHARKHENLTAVMETFVGRSDGETTDCKKCGKEGFSFQVHWNKEPDMTRLPVSLKFIVDPHQTVPAELVLEVCGVFYTLLSVVFGDGRHFKCNIVLNELWYHYDSLGFPEKRQKNDNYPTVPRLVRIEPSNNHMTPPHPATKYKPIAYRYVRRNASTLDTVTLDDALVEDFPRELQFNSMWRLLVNGY